MIRAILFLSLAFAALLFTGCSSLIDPAHVEILQSPVPIITSPPLDKMVEGDIFIYSKETEHHLDLLRGR